MTSAVQYDEPTKVINNLIVTIEESTLGKLDSSKVISVTKKEAKEMKKTGTLTADTSTSSVIRCSLRVYQTNFYTIQ